MRKWVRVQGGRAAEIIGFDPAGIFHPDLEWVQVAEGTDVKQGYSWSGGVFSPPAPPVKTLDDIRRERRPLMLEAQAKLDRHRNQKEYQITLTLTDEQAAAWAVYLQALRDVTLQDPNNVVWPEKPQ